MASACLAAGDRLDCADRRKTILKRMNMLVKKTFVLCNFHRMQKPFRAAFSRLLLTD
jgi:hypothetical protein